MSVSTAVLCHTQDLKAADEAAEAADAEAADPDAVERKRLAEAEEWRTQQLRSGQAGENANFQVGRLRWGLKDWVR